MHNRLNRRWSLHLSKINAEQSKGRKQEHVL
jgi:hypothetical protein